MMKLGRILVCFSLAAGLALSASAQSLVPEVDYNHPKKYVVGGIKVEGNTYYSDQQIISQTGMREGMDVTVPGEEFTNMVKRLWIRSFFEDVAISIDSLNATSDTAFFKIAIKERPRMSRWSFTGIKTSEQKDIMERVSLRRGGVFSEYVEKTTCDIIKRYFSEKGFLLCDVTVDVAKDTMVRNAIKVTFNIDKGEKIKIRDINFIGNENVKEFKIAKEMKKTKSNKIYNFFHSKKFNEKEYIADKKNAISAFNEAGYRDARLVRDSIYYVYTKKGKKKLAIDLVFDEGEKYYFRDISWTGNSVYSSEALNEVLGIKSGDIYDVVTMEKRLYGGGKAMDIL